MAEKIVTKPSCSECGSEALDEAVFCFHCGASLALEDEIESVMDKPIQPPPGDPFEDPADEGKAVKEKKKAAGTRRRRGLREAEGAKAGTTPQTEPGVMRLRRIETRWSAGDESPNFWFFIVSAGVFAVAFLIFLLSMYLR